MIGRRASADGPGSVPVAAFIRLRPTAGRPDTRRTTAARLMRLSWNEVRARAAAFVEDWKDAAYEKGETQSFYNAFFDVFGVRRRNVARYEAHVAKLDNRSGFIDLFWPGVLIVEQKSAGRDLKAATNRPGSISTRCRNASARASSW